MPIVQGNIGSLTHVKQELERQGIGEFRSLQEVMAFQNAFTVFQQEVLDRTKQRLQQELVRLPQEIAEQTQENIRLKQETEARLLQKKQGLEAHIEQLNRDTNNQMMSKLLRCLRRRLMQWRWRKLHRNSPREVEKVCRPAREKLNDLNRRHSYLQERFGEALKESCRNELEELQRKKDVIDNLSSFIYGALGEQQVVQALSELPNSYTLFNDFTLSFRKALYHRQEDAYIKSVQADHVLVGPSGVFLIETKNWSRHSLQGQNLRSPVQQIQRTGYVLYRLFKGRLAAANLSLVAHHWGARKIPIRNLIVFTQQKPLGEFDYVKILSLSELPGYIRSFKPVFSAAETQEISKFLLDLKAESKIKVV